MLDRDRHADSDVRVMGGRASAPWGSVALALEVPEVLSVEQVNILDVPFSLAIIPGAGIWRLECIALSVVGDFRATMKVTTRTKQVIKTVFRFTTSRSWMSMPLSAIPESIAMQIDQNVRRSGVSVFRGFQAAPASVVRLLALLPAVAEAIMGSSGAFCVALQPVIAATVVGFQADSSSLWAPELSLFCGDDPAAMFRQAIAKVEEESHLFMGGYYAEYTAAKPSHQRGALRAFVGRQTATADFELVLQEEAEWYAIGCYSVKRLELAVQETMRANSVIAIYGERIRRPAFAAGGAYGFLAAGWAARVGATVKQWSDAKLTVRELVGVNDPIFVQLEGLAGRWGPIDAGQAAARFCGRGLLTAFVWGEERVAVRDEELEIRGTEQTFPPSTTYEEIQCALRPDTPERVILLDGDDVLRPRRFPTARTLLGRERLRFRVLPEGTAYGISLLVPVAVEVWDLKRECESWSLIFLRRRTTFGQLFDRLVPAGETPHQYVASQTGLHGTTFIRKMMKPNDFVTLPRIRFDLVSCPVPERVTEFARLLKDESCKKVAIEVRKLGSEEGHPAFTTLGFAMIGRKITGKRLARRFQQEGMVLVLRLSCQLLQTKKLAEEEAVWSQLQQASREREWREDRPVICFQTSM